MTQAEPVYPQVRVHLTLLDPDDQQLGGLTRDCIGRYACLPRPGDQVDIDEGGDLPPEYGEGAIPVATVIDGSWTADLASVQIALIVDGLDADYASRLNAWLVRHGWDDWFSNT